MYICKCTYVYMYIYIYTVCMVSPWFCQSPHRCPPPPRPTRAAAETTAQTSRILWTRGCEHLTLQGDVKATLGPVPCACVLVCYLCINRLWTAVCTGVDSADEPHPVNKAVWTVKFTRGCELLCSQTVYIQRRHEHTRTWNWSVSGFGSLRGAPLNTSRCSG